MDWVPSRFHMEPLKSWQARWWFQMSRCRCCFLFGVFCFLQSHPRCAPRTSETILCLRVTAPTRCVRQDRWFQIFFMFNPIGKWSNLTSICFKMGWFNHQLESWSDDLSIMVKWYVIPYVTTNYRKVVQEISIISPDTFSGTGAFTYRIE